MYTILQIRNSITLSKFQTSRSPCDFSSAFRWSMIHSIGMSRREREWRTITCHLSSIFPARQWVCVRCSSTTSCSLRVDAAKYSRYLFAVIDRSHKGTFTFDVSLKRFCIVRRFIFHRIIFSPCRFFVEEQLKRNYDGFFVSMISMVKEYWHEKWEIFHSLMSIEEIWLEYCGNYSINLRTSWSFDSTEYWWEWYSKPCRWNHRSKTNALSLCLLDLL